jgi:hypothetical protein
VRYPHWSTQAARAFDEYILHYEANLLPRTLAAVLVRAVSCSDNGFLPNFNQHCTAGKSLREHNTGAYPIKIKVKKEKEQSFKDLKNEKWLREFELEVTNTGDRPIYYLEIVMDTDVKFQGSGPEIGFSTAIWSTRTRRYRHEGDKR